MQIVNILMLGGKRCGKTTVLSSMCNEIDKALAGTELRLVVTNDQTQADLSCALKNIMEKLKVFEVPLTRVEVDDNPTSAQKTYSFGLKLGRSSKGIPFQIHDIPGEWLTDSHQDQVKNLIHNSQVIIIAIDTPYLFAKMMSDKGYGVYHEEYNKPMEIANFFKNSLGVDDIANHLILFVPMKCERYYHLTHTSELNAFQRDYMQEIVNAVGNGYRELLHYLKATPELILGSTVAITPILSAGGIDFVHFKKDKQTGKIISLYQEAEFLKEDERGFKPQFCEQPMVYSLVYVLSQILEEMTEKKSLQNMHYGLTPKEIEDSLRILRKKIKCGNDMYSEDGFLIIQDYYHRL